MWHPHKTVATVVEREQHFLMVEERVEGNTVFNQPAGHLEPGESLVEAAVRETLEETRWQVKINALLGLYHFISDANGTCYIRTCFTAEPIAELQERALDTEIVCVHWMTLVDIKKRAGKLRSPVVLRVLEDYMKGKFYPLSLITSL